MLDLHLFLGRSVNIAKLDSDPSSDALYGGVPQPVVDEEDDLIRVWHENSEDLKGLVTVCNNAYKKYLQTRPAPSAESVSRFKKEYRDIKTAPHPIYRT